MLDTSSVALFVAAALALLITPGPAVLYIVARSLEQGRVAGFVSTLGIALASTVHVVFAALGLSALLVQSAVAFTVVKYLGATYLIYLGARTLLQRTEPSRIERVRTLRLSRIFSQGFVVNLLNPKTALFFLAFLPQFVSPERGSVAVQIGLLGAIFVGLAIVSDGLYAAVAGTARGVLSGNRLAAGLRKVLVGGIYIALGVTTALVGSGRSR